MKSNLLSLLVLSFFFSSCNGQTAKSFESISPKAFAEKIKETANPQIFDVRSPEEFEGQHIENATNINWNGNDFVVKAVALALKKHPTVNSSWLGDVIRRNQHVHIGVAVAVEDGLLVPVIRFADEKSLSEISSEVKDLAGKAKTKKLQPSDWEGNTFTISNLGMFGIESFTAIVNPPDSCILAIGGIKEIPVVKNGQVVPGNVMKVTLSCDHRVVDGATGSAFLLTFKEYMENTIALLL